MTIHKTGYRTIVASFIFLTMLNLLFYKLLNGNNIILLSLTTLSAILFGIIVFFFRIPKRAITLDSRKILAPSDGTIVVVEEVEETEYIKGPATQISIFMSPLNVHCQWFPVNGKVVYTRHHDGSYLVAWHPKSSTENERNTIVVETENGIPIVFRQIAGALARRIVCFTSTGDEAKQDKQAGFIKFGSRIDVFVPMNAKIKVNLDDKVQATQTVLAEL